MTEFVNGEVGHIQLCQYIDFFLNIDLRNIVYRFICKIVCESVGYFKVFFYGLRTEHMFFGFSSNTTVYICPLYIFLIR